MKRSNMFKQTVVCLVAVGLIAPLALAETQTTAPKNIIFMISDGCGYECWDSATIYQYGVLGQQVYDQFPIQVGMTTYSENDEYSSEQAWTDFTYVDTMYTDSAAAGTAMSCGVKTYDGAIGMVTGAQSVQHFMEVAEAQGKSTGVISSVQFNHATPASFVAHNVARGNYGEIAEEMIQQSACEVIMGCGHPLYDNDNEPRAAEDYYYKYVKDATLFGELSGGTAGGDMDGDSIADPWTFIDDRADFQALATGDAPDRVFGLARCTHTLQYNRSGSGYRKPQPIVDEPGQYHPSVADDVQPYDDPLNEGVPTLEEMTKGALNVLDNDDDGFCLMVEGGAVDWAGHGNNIARMIEEQVDFNNSVEAVVEWIGNNGGWEDTLLIVTTDHETGHLKGVDANPAEMPIVSEGQGRAPAVSWHSGSHTNAICPVYANGAGAATIRDFAVNKDLMRRRYLDNTQLGQTCFNVLEGTANFEAVWLAY